MFIGTGSLPDFLADGQVDLETLVPQTPVSTNVLHQTGECDRLNQSLNSYGSMEPLWGAHTDMSRTESCEYGRILSNINFKVVGTQLANVGGGESTEARLEPVGSVDAAGHLLHSLISSFQDGLGRVSQQRRLTTNLEMMQEKEVYPPRNNEDHVQFDNAKNRTTPTWVTGWNVLNLIQGIGILGIPYAFAHGGWVSIPAALVLALTCCFTGCLLGECLYEYPRGGGDRPSTSHLDIRNRVRVRSTNACIAADVFPCGGRGFVNVIVILELFGACVLYIILLGQSMTGLFGSLCDLSTATWTVVMVYLCLPVLLWPQMRLVAWFGVIALLGLFGTILVIFVYSGLELARVPSTAWRLPPPSWSQLPVSLSIVIFSYCAHSALPGIEGLMARPEKYNCMLKISFIIAGVVKLLFGVFTALVFQEDIAQAVTDSMTAWPVLHTAVHSLVLINVLFSLPLIFHILGEQLDCSILNFVNHDFFTSTSCLSIGKVWFFSSRCALLNLGLMCATMVPQFALIMGLVGAVSGSLLCFILPAFFHLRLFWDRLSLFAKGLRVVIIIFGVAVGVLGTVTSIIDLKDAF